MRFKATLLKFFKFYFFFKLLFHFDDFKKFKILFNLYELSQKPTFHLKPPRSKKQTDASSSRPESLQTVDLDSTSSSQVTDPKWSSLKGSRPSIIREENVKKSLKGLQRVKEMDDTRHAQHPDVARSHGQVEPHNFSLFTSVTIFYFHCQSLEFCVFTFRQTVFSHANKTVHTTFWCSNIKFLLGLRGFPFAPPKNGQINRRFRYLVSRG